MNDQRSQKNLNRKAGGRRRPVSHRVMSTFLAMLMVFTTVMPYTAFAEDTLVIGDGSGSGAIELVGAGSTAAGTEAEGLVENDGGSVESSLISTDQGDGETAEDGAGTPDAAADSVDSAASTDDLFGTVTSESEMEEAGAVNPYLDDETRDIYLVNRNSYEDLQVWNENKDGDEADFWVQHLEEADTDHPYTLYGNDASSVSSEDSSDSENSDASSADLSYRFEEIKMTDTGLKDAKGGEIYSAQIPQSWDYVTFAYFADDPDLTEGTELDEAGYPQGVATNGRHRTMVIKVSDDKNYVVGVPLTKDEATLAGLQGGDMIWKALEIQKAGTQAFYVNAEHFEDANGNAYRRPMAERLDAEETEESETAAETDETQSETATETTETQSEIATETAETQGETAAEITDAVAETTETDAAISTEPETETAEDTEKASETEKAAETEAVDETETEAELVDETESETELVDETETETETEAKPVRPIRRQTVRKAPAASQVGNYIFLDLSNMNANNSIPNWKNANNIYLYNYTKANGQSNQNAYFHSYTGRDGNLVWWDVSNTSNFASNDQFMLSISNDWSTLDDASNKYYRTTLLGKIGECKGMLLSWGGHDYIDNNKTYYGEFSKTPYKTGLTLNAGGSTVDLTSENSVTVPVTLTAGTSMSLALDPGYDFKDYTYSWSKAKDSAGAEYVGLTMSADSGTGVVVYAAGTAASGTATITLTASSGSSTITRTINLTVEAKHTVLTIAADQALILVGDSETLSVVADPEYTDSVQYTWNITSGADVLTLSAEETDQITTDTTVSAKPASSVLMDDQEETPSSLISQDSNDRQVSAGGVGVKAEESAKTQSDDTPAAAPTPVSPLTTSTPEVQVTGLKTGTATVTVSAVDNADSSKTVTSEPVTIQVASAVLDPTEISLDLTQDSQASMDMNLQVGSGVQYDSINWAMTMNSQADPEDSSTAYSDAEKTAFNDNVTLTPSDETGKALSATVKAVENENLPTDGRATVTVTLKNGETVVQTLTATVAVASNPASKDSIYYDATFSRVNQAGDSLSNNAIPYEANASAANGDLWVAFYDDNGNKKNITASSVNGQYTVDGGCVKILGTTLKTVTVNGHTYKYTYEIPLSLKPSDATKVQFAATKEALGYITSANATIKATIPTDIKGACFYADGGDFKVYWGTQKNRFGYWDKAYTVRDPEKERTQNLSKVTTSGSIKFVDGNAGAPDYSKSLDNAGTSTNPGTSGGKSGDDVYWANSTFYDYYSDVELSGLNRSTNLSSTDNNASGSSRCYATFRQFDQALSDAYEAKDEKYPMYTGHFQPTIDKWGNQYISSGVSASLGLYGSNNINTFFAVNNSTKDMNGNGDDSNRKYDMAAQGLWESSSLFFNSSFLSGNNSKNSVLGKVYNNVSFPFTRYDRDNNGIYYYGFDSATTTLHMENGYLLNTGNQAWSKNTDATGTRGKDGVSNEYGFFPLNSTSVNGPSAMQYNYGFGCKLEVPFSITEDGNLIDRNGNKAPQAFTFSGDDDVWVFIDGQLALDLGGDHGRVSGCINFSKDTTYTYKYFTKSGGNYTKTVPAHSSFVSGVKVSPGSNEYAIGTTPNGQGKTEDLSTLISGLGTGMHTLTLYYMERGQWESNMKVEFNFTPRKVLTVKKQFIENGNDITESITSSSAKVYAMVTRHSSQNTSTEEVYPVNASGTDTISKYCIELNHDNEWKATVDELPKYVSGTDGSNGEWVYTVREVLIDDKGVPYTNGTDAVGIAYPKVAEEGNLVKVNGTTYEVKNGTIDASGTTTLVNTRVVSTSIKVKKAFSGTDATALPKQIRIRLERTVIAPKKDSDGNFVKDENGNYTYEIPEKIPSDAEWTPVTDPAEVGADGWYIWTPKKGETDSWTHTFEGLKVNPDNDASKGVYVYRVVEASSTSGNAAADGGTTTYDSKSNTSNSYWVHYEGASNGNAKNWVSAITDKKDKNKNYTGATVSMTNQLIVHLPSTGSTTAMTLTILSLICLAAAGSFGIFGRKKYVE